MKISRIFVRKVGRLHIRHNVKDRLFRYIFERDREALLQLYNALNGTDYREAQALKIMTMENVIYLSMKNDLAFSIAGVLNLYEQQSSYNPNMPVRFLIYLGQEYQEVISEQGLEKIYGSQLLKLPTPRCVVFFNGRGNAPEESVLRLSDAYEQREEDPDVELRVRMININFGHNQELMEKCHRLWEYSFFVERLNQGLRNGLKLRRAAEEAIDYCIRQGILEDILTMARREVLGTILSEYNEKKVRELWKREAREEGWTEGRELGRTEGMELGVELGLAKGRELGLAKGKVEEKKSLAQKLSHRGDSMNMIADLLDVDIKQVEQWLDEDKVPQ